MLETISTISQKIICILWNRLILYDNCITQIRYTYKLLRFVLGTSDEDQNKTVIMIIQVSSGKLVVCKNLYIPCNYTMTRCRTCNVTFHVCNRTNLNIKRILSHRHTFSVDIYLILSSRRILVESKKEKDKKQNIFI